MTVREMSLPKAPVNPEAKVVSDRLHALEARVTDVERRVLTVEQAREAQRIVQESAKR